MSVFDYPLELVKLARSFPSLADAPGLEPFDFKRFQEWVRLHHVFVVHEVSGEALRQARHALYAGRFVVAVWRGERWAVGEFNVVEAMHVWDERHRAAFRAWAEKPWCR